jgi:hypothetical protein
LETVLGLVGMVIFVVATIALAAGVTYLIVRVSPATRGEKRKPKPSAGS